MNPKHQKVTTYKPISNDTVQIDTKSYYERLSQEVTEVEKNVLTNFVTLKQDVEASLSHVIEDKCQQLVLTIKLVDGKPKLTKRYMTLRKNYPRQ